jgi:hypothetical protein
VHSVATDGAHINELETAVANRFNLKTTAVAKAAVDLQISANGAWRACRDARALEDDTQDPYVRALAEATFVLLGVEAYDFRYSIKGTTDG